MTLNIKKAIKKPGALRKSLGIKKGKTIPASKLKAAAKKPVAKKAAAPAAKSVGRPARRARRATRAVVVAAK